MIRHDCPQGGQRWINLRLGIPSASEFHRIVSPGGKLSKQADGYMMRLLAEAMLSHHLDDVETKWMVRGSELEEAAVRLYEMQYDCETQPVGFITNDAGTIGASPDRIVGSKRGVEVKAPAPNTQIARLLSDQIDEGYKPQIQGQIWICEFDVVDNIYYHPELPPSVVRVYRDADYIKILSDSLNAFVDQLAAKRAKLESRFGPFPKIELEPKQDGIGSLGITNEDLQDLLAEHGMTL